jgi:hypothetical protein
MFEDITRATAFCCSAALAIAAEISLIWPIVSLIVPIACTAPLVASGRHFR